MNEREIFAAALELPTDDDRRAFLDENCDDATRERIERLLAERSQLGSFLEHPPVEDLAADAAGRLNPTIELAAGGTHDDGDFPMSAEEHRGEMNDDLPLAYLAPSDRADSLGRLGHYEVLEVIGHGAFGTVLKAFDEKLQRVVAVKVMSLEMAATSPARKRFLREARSSAAIRHENVVSIHAVEDEPIPYLVMEYIPGQTLQAAARTRPDRLDCPRGPLDSASRSPTDWPPLIRRG